MGGGQKTWKVLTSLQTTGLTLVLNIIFHSIQKILRIYYAYAKINEISETILGQEIFLICNKEIIPWKAHIN